jgi:hypothetical protein
MKGCRDSRFVAQNVSIEGIDDIMEVSLHLPERRELHRTCSSEDGPGFWLLAGKERSWEDVRLVLQLAEVGDLASFKVSTPSGKTKSWHVIGRALLAKCSVPAASHTCLLQSSFFPHTFCSFERAQFVEMLCVTGNLGPPHVPLSCLCPRPWCKSRTMLANALSGATADTTSPQLSTESIRFLAQMG